MSTIQNLALDRIKDINEIHDEYISSDIDWDDYFSDFIGVTKNNAEPVEVRLLIMDDQQAAYIRTKPLHQSQKPLRKVDDGFETSIKVIPNYELEKLIMSFGERIRIIAPGDFRRRVGERIKASALLY
jgi:predicted DNA-binding transcriptional regulator YafY